MNIWLIHLGEPLPIEDGQRLLRYGILAEMLSTSGNKVIQWAPSFSHCKKRQRSDRDCTINVSAHYQIELLYAPGYKRHIGIKRFLFHRMVAKSFFRRAQQIERPDIILVSMPVPEMVSAAIQFGKENDVPVIVDVRDLWPDYFVDITPRPLRKLAKYLLKGTFSRNRELFQKASAIVGISNNFLEWGLRNAGRSARVTDRVFPMAYLRPKLSEEARINAERRWLERGISQNGIFRLCFFCQFGQLYDFNLIAAAATELANRGRMDIQFVLSGRGPKWEPFRRKVKDLPNIVQTGWIDAADIAVIMDWSDVGFIPYKHGMKTTFPNKVIDYFSGGLPVLTTKGGELAFLLEQRQCGMTFEAGNVNNFVNAVIKMSDTPEKMKEMSVCVSKVFAMKFDAQKVYSKMINYLKEMAQDNWSQLSQYRKCA